MKPRAPDLFQVLPSEVFRPLASANRRHYWNLLALIYERFFGPDAALPPVQGWDRRDVIILIERWLDAHDPWEPEDGSAPDTPIQVRANLYFARLADAGWFVEERVGLARVIGMPPVTTRFMGDLLSFVDYEPPAVGAKMRSIESALLRVKQSPQPGDDLDEAATQSRALVASMSAMALRIRELMRSLSAQATTADAIRQIFSEYIGKLYMADYAALAGADHPLARKSAVISLAQDIGLTDQRERLVQWYATHRTDGDDELAERRLEKALGQIKGLARLQDFLDRLEGDMRRMHQRMLALIDYRLHAPSHLEVRIKRAIAGVNDDDGGRFALPMPPGQLLSGELLYKPRVKRPPIPRQADKARVMSPEQEARMRLRARARDARRVLTGDIQTYLLRVMGGQLQVKASELPIDSIKDFRIVQTLASFALAARTNQSASARGRVGKLPGVIFTPTGGELVPSGFLTMADFYITRAG